MNDAPLVPPSANHQELHGLEFRMMPTTDLDEKGIEINVKEAEKEGREAKIQSVKQIEEFIREEKKKAAAAASPVKEDELSRVTDSRRRPFGGEREMAPPEKPASDENA